MANRENGLTRPKPGTRGVKNPEMNMRTSVKWPKAPGPRGPSWKASMQGFKEIKEGAVQDKADEASLQGGMSGAMSGASMGSMAGPWGALAGAVVGGLMGAFGGGDEEEKPPEQKGF